jgi:hypothetical protein
MQSANSIKCGSTWAAEAGPPAELDVVVVLGVFEPHAAITAAVAIAAAAIGRLDMVLDMSQVLSG